MKTLTFFIAAYFSCSACIAQDPASDITLTSNVIGRWQHVSSTYPNGEVMTYEREIMFLGNGNGVCTKFMPDDTLEISFQWEVKDSVISLFTTNKHGRRIEADAQYISLVDMGRLYLTDAYDDTTQFGRVCCYRRTSGEIAKY